VYVLHGDQDKVVSVNYARQMRKILNEFHTDLSYYEYPNGEHWFGDQSVDWKPLFEFSNGILFFLIVQLIALILQHLIGDIFKFQMGLH
jgi:uncharacterized membrane protein